MTIKEHRSDMRGLVEAKRVLTKPAYVRRWGGEMYELAARLEEIVKQERARRENDN